jgi:hypothetical protein
MSQPTIMQGDTSLGPFRLGSSGPPCRQALVKRSTDQSTSSKS